MVITRKRTEYAVAGLLAVVVAQAIGYGLVSNLNFFLRNLSVVGGLLMVISDSWVRKRFVPAGLPQLDEKDRKMYVQFAGRVLLIFLFVGFVFAGHWGFWRVLVSLFGLMACVMVVVGFKAKWSAILLVVLLSFFNVLVNNFWTVCFFFLFFYFFSLFCCCKSLWSIDCSCNRSTGCLLLLTINSSFFCSFILTTLTRTLSSTTSSRSCLLCKSLHQLSSQLARC